LRQAQGLKAQNAKSATAWVLAPGVLVTMMPFSFAAAIFDALVAYAVAGNCLEVSGAFSMTSFVMK
jgi:uncharacterized protein (DUF2062 family)